jgi:hypothetical protein
VVRPEIDRTGVCAFPNELAARGGFAPAASWSSPLGPILILKLSVTAYTIDTPRQGLAAAVAADGFEHKINRCFRRRHACDMWREENPRMASERVARRQRLVFGDVKNGG